MISTHEILLKGEPVEKDVISIPLLLGVINILEQHDTIQEMEFRMETIKCENVAIKCRVESLENWVLKQDDIIKKLDEKLSRWMNMYKLLKKTLRLIISRKRLMVLKLPFIA